MAELACTAATRTFATGVGVHEIDLDIQAGEVHALVGLNGAGKTTLMRLLLGMLTPEYGDIRLHGRPLPEVSRSAWTRVGHMVGHPLAYPDLTVRANLRLAALLHGVPRPQAAAVVTDALADLRLEEYADRRIRTLSAGNLQRVGLAAVLQHRPNVIVLDEPTNALDPAGVLLLRELLLARRAEGAAILVSSHHLDEVARIADRITLMNRGRLIGCLEPGSLNIERAFFSRVLTDDESRVS